MRRRVVNDDTPAPIPTPAPEPETQAPVFRHRPMYACGKVSYPSLKAVRTALNARTKGHQRNRSAQGLHYYMCPNCGQYHLGKNHRRP